MSAAEVSLGTRSKFRNPKSEMNRYIILYDFISKPSATFYRILKDEFGITAGSPEHVQRSALVVRDGFAAYGIAALVEEFGGDALVYKIIDNPDSSRIMEEARSRIACIRRQRRSRKRRPELAEGRKPK
jgi:hypothetical protein